MGQRQGCAQLAMLSCHRCFAAETGERRDPAGAIRETVGIFRTHEYAPRVLIANANLVGNWDNWTEFRRLEALGLMMYGQMTAGSWIYIGSQGSSRHLRNLRLRGAPPFRRSLKGKILVTVALGAWAEPSRSPRPCSVLHSSAWKWIRSGFRNGSAHRIVNASPTAWRSPFARRGRGQQGRCHFGGLVGNCAEVLPEMVRRGFTPAILTDQTSAHDPLNGYVPAASR